MKKVLFLTVVMLSSFGLVGCSNDSTTPVDPEPTAVETITHNGLTYIGVESPITTRVWLDRNLGASQACASLTDAACYGDYYQWGRETDGHEDSNSTSVSAQSSVVVSAGTTFFEGYPDWASAGIDDNGSLRQANWNITDGTMVCPTNYRVPTLAEIRAETVDAGMTTPTEAYDSFLKLPTAGFRSEGAGAAMSYVGTAGMLWTQEKIDADLSYSVVYADGFFDTSNFSSASGLSVRCIKN